MSRRSTVIYFGFFGRRSLNKWNIYLKKRMWYNALTFFSTLVRLSAVNYYDGEYLFCLTKIWFRLLSECAPQKSAFDVWLISRLHRHNNTVYAMITMYLYQRSTYFSYYYVNILLCPTTVIIIIVHNIILYIHINVNYFWGPETRLYYIITGSSIWVINLTAMVLLLQVVHLCDGIEIWGRYYVIGDIPI